MEGNGRDPVEAQSGRFKKPKAPATPKTRPLAEEGMQAREQDAPTDAHKPSPQVGITDAGVENHPGRPENFPTTHSDGDDMSKMKIIASGLI